MPFGMGFGELVLITVIVVVVFGATKLPQLGDGLESSVKRFRDSIQSAQRPRLLLQSRERRRWTLSDWLLLVTAVALAAAVIANAALHPAR
jgi:sec-independent protein translocase protein TatA